MTLLLSVQTLSADVRQILSETRAIFEKLDALDKQVRELRLDAPRERAKLVYEVRFYWCIALFFLINIKSDTYRTDEPIFC